MKISNAEKLTDAGHVHEEVERQLVKKLFQVLSGYGEVIQERPPSGEWHPDALIRCRAGGREYRVPVVSKRHGWPRDALQALGLLEVWQGRERGDVPVFVATYIPPSSRQMLRQKGVGYVDLEGNTWLRFGPVLIERDFGDRISHPTTTLTPVDRLASGRSSRILRVLLENRETTWTHVALSREANVSLGLAWRAIGRLAAEGWIEKRRGAITVKEPGAILDFWASRYDHDRHVERRYYAPIRSFEDLVERLWRTLAGNRSVKYALTGPAGALLVAPYVRFAVYHLYVASAEIAHVGQPQPGDLVEATQEARGQKLLLDALELKPVDQSGANVILLDPPDEGVFYRLQSHRDLPVVCNTQLYLDLMTYPGRGREQAEYLRQQVLKF